MTPHPVRQWVFLVLMILGAQAFGVSIPPGEPVETLSPAYTRNREMIGETRRLRQAEDLEGLENLAARLRSSREALDGGTWLLSHFYAEASRVGKSEPDASRDLAFLHRWAEERPESITAQVCLARGLINHAWNARGGGWADSVTEEGALLMEERLKRAWEVLERSGPLAEQCPGWFEAAQVVALGQGWKRDEYLDFVEEAIRREPTYGRFYTNACLWLLPRWYGEPGDFENWIAEQAGGYEAAYQDEIYSRLVWLALNMPVDDAVRFGPGRLDWERTRRGFEQRIAREPDNLNLRFGLVSLALLADDRETVRAQFDATDRKYVPEVWRETTFEDALRYAYAGGPNPLTNAGEDKRRSRPIAPEARERAERILRKVGGGVGGAIAGVVLLILAIQRRRVGAGLAALAASVIVGMWFGTLATIIPALAMYLYFRKLLLTHPPRLALPSGWLVLLWTILLAVLNIALQIGASILATVPLVASGVRPEGSEILAALFQNGVAFQIMVSAAWITFLALLAVSGPQSRSDWRRMLGFERFPLVPGLLWAAGAGTVVFLIGQLLTPFMDARSQESLQQISQGAQAPFWFFLAVVVAAPVLEELIFRGYAFAGWIDRLGTTGAIGVPAVLFAVCHLQYGWVGLAFVFLMGLILGVLRWKTASVLPCMVVHLLNNLVHFVMSVRSVPFESGPL